MESLPARGERQTLSCEMSFVTDPAMLATLLPSSFELRGIPSSRWSVGYHSEIAWLAGRSYNTFGVYIPATHCGNVRTDGSFNAVLWENLTDPILTGRDELGIPKIYAEIPPLAEMASTPTSPVQAGLGLSSRGWKSICKLGSRTSPTAGISDSRLQVRTEDWSAWRSRLRICDRRPRAKTRRVVMIECWQGSGSITFFKAAWRDMPTQCHIVNKLAALPIIETRSARMASSIGQKDLSDTHLFMKELLSVCFRQIVRRSR